MPNESGHNIIVPDGRITVYEHIPLDKSYEHSVKVQAGSSFDSMLSGFTNYTITAQSYSRLTSSQVRIEMPISTLQKCNYMRISDVSLLAGKVYYAFIDSVEYVNNATTDVFFTIDVLMTYWNDFTVPANFVEREHCAVSDDVVGKNVVPESFELGELICHYKSGKYYLRSQGVYTVIMYTPNMNESGGDIDINSSKYVYYDGGVGFPTTTSSIPSAQLMPLVRNQFGGVVCCLPRQMHVENTTQLAIDIGAVQAAINLILKSGGSIISVVQVNGEIYNDNFGTTSITTRTFNVNEQGSFKKLDGTFYSNVKNKKLLQYPFKRLICSNNNGNEAEYKWELFTTRDGDIVQAQFDYFNVMLPDIKAYIYPTYYRGLPIDYETGVTLEDFPTPCWTEDSYSRWWGQNKTNYGLSLATGLLSTGLMIATGGAGGTSVTNASRVIDDVTNVDSANISPNGINLSRTMGAQTRQELMNSTTQFSGSKARQGMALGMGAIGIARTLAQKQIAKDTPDQTHIQNYAASINWLQDRLGFTFYDIGITGEMAEIIDSYFEMFGYATHKLKVPNFVNGGRPNWDYIKMQNAQINPQTGTHGIPSEAISQIQEIFNNGITLWAQLADVGKYNLNNHGS